MLGIEASTLDIANPFGRDRHDLPLEAICARICRNLEDLIPLEPACGRSQASDARSAQNDYLNCDKPVSKSQPKDPD